METPARWDSGADGGVVWQILTCPPKGVSGVRWGFRKQLIPSRLRESNTQVTRDVADSAWAAAITAE
jgi:hypothetical protein